MDEDGETAVYVVVSGASVAAAEKPESNGKPDPKAKSDKGKAGKDKAANATPAWLPSAAWSRSATAMPITWK